jgi:hypothetical protein
MCEKLEVNPYLITITLWYGVVWAGIVWKEDGSKTRGTVRD